MQICYLGVIPSVVEGCGLWACMKPSSLQVKNNSLEFSFHRSWNWYQSLCMDPVRIDDL